MSSVEVFWVVMGRGGFQKVMGILLQNRQTI